MIEKSLSAWRFSYLEDLEGGQSRDLWGCQSIDIFRGGPVKKNTLYYIHCVQYIVCILYTVQFQFSFLQIFNFFRVSFLMVPKSSFWTPFKQSGSPQFSIETKFQKLSSFWEKKQEQFKDNKENERKEQRNMRILSSVSQLWNHEY